MNIEPLPGVDAAQLQRQLQEAYERSFTVFASTTDAEKVSAYLQWVAETERRLRSVVSEAVLRRLLLTQRYWSTLANPAERSSDSIVAVQSEVDLRQRELKQAIDSVEGDRRRWSSPLPDTRFVIADTNIYLHTPNVFKGWDWRAAIDEPNLTMSPLRLVVPMIVIDELDSAKRGLNRAQARHCLKRLHDLFHRSPAATHVLVPRQNDGEAVTVELLADPVRHTRLTRPDDELVDRCLALTSYAHDVRFLSYDTGAVLRAQIVGLRAHRLEHQA